MALMVFRPRRYCNVRVNLESAGISAEAGQSWIVYLFVNAALTELPASNTTGLPSVADTFSLQVGKSISSSLQLLPSLPCHRLTD